MALLQDKDVYMETVEETKDESEEPDEDGNTEEFGMAGRKQP